MSVQAMTWVLEHSPTKGTDRLVLLALANHAPKDTVDGAWECWPGVALIAREAGLDRERTAQESLSRLVKMRAIQRVLNGAPVQGRRDRRPNLYRILTSHGVSSAVTPSVVDNCSRGDAATDPAGGSRGDASQQNGVTDSGVTGCRIASPKPSMNRQKNRGAEPNPSAVYEADEAKRSERDALYALEPIATAEQVAARKAEAIANLEAARKRKVS